MAADTHDDRTPSLSTLQPGQADAILEEIHQLMRHIEAIEADMNDSIERIKTAAAAFATPRRIRLRTLLDGLTARAGSNGEGFFDGHHDLTIPVSRPGMCRPSPDPSPSRGR